MIDPQLAEAFATLDKMDCLHLADEIVWVVDNTQHPSITVLRPMRVLSRPEAIATVKVWDIAYQSPADDWIDVRDEEDLCATVEMLMRPPTSSGCSHGESLSPTMNQVAARHN